MKPIKTYHKLKTGITYELINDENGYCIDAYKGETLLQRYYLGELTTLGKPMTTDLIIIYYYDDEYRMHYVNYCAGAEFFADSDEIDAYFKDIIYYIEEAQK